VRKGHEGEDFGLRKEFVTWRKIIYSQQRRRKVPWKISPSQRLGSCRGRKTPGETNRRKAFVVCRKGTRRISSCKRFFHKNERNDSPAWGQGPLRGTRGSKKGDGAPLEPACPRSAGAAARKRRQESKRGSSLATISREGAEHRHDFPACSSGRREASTRDGKKSAGFY